MGDISRVALSLRIRKMRVETQTVGQTVGLKSLNYRNTTSIAGAPAEFISEQFDGWHRPVGMRLFPDNRPIEDEQLPENILKFVGDGWLPPAPFITKDMPVTAFGSCFAVHIERCLRDLGYSTAMSLYKIKDDRDANYWSHSLFIKCGEGFVNTFSMLYQFEWLLENKAPNIEVWLKADGRVQRYVDDNSEAGRKLLHESKVLIITLGLSEVVEDLSTRKVMWAGVPKSAFAKEPQRYLYRVSSVAENVANLENIVRIIRSRLGNIPIIFTLSPIALNATHRPVSVITANAESKAILRAAIGELMRSHEADNNLRYWPAYEIITSYFDDPYGRRTYGGANVDGRHPSDDAIYAVCMAFAKAYCA